MTQQFNLSSQLRAMSDDALLARRAELRVILSGAKIEVSMIDSILSQRNPAPEPTAQQQAEHDRIERVTEQRIATAAAERKARKRAEWVEAV